MDALALHRFHFAFTITYHYLFPQLTMGLALLIVILKTMGAADRRGTLQPRGPLLGQDLRHQLRHGRRHRHPDGVPVRHQLGAVLEAAGGVIGQTLAMEGVFSFFLESTLPGALPVRRKAAGPEGALVRGVHGVPGLVAFRLLHHRHERLDAAPGGLRDRRERADRADQPLGAAAEPVGPVAVPAQHDRLGGDGGLRDGVRRRVLPAAAASTRIRPDVLEARGDGRLRRLRC